MVSELRWILSLCWGPRITCWCGEPPHTHTRRHTHTCWNWAQKPCWRKHTPKHLGAHRNLCSLVSVWPSAPSPRPPEPLPSSSLSLNPESTSSYQSFCLLHSQAPPDALHSLSSFLTSLSQLIQSCCQPFSPLRPILARSTITPQIAKPAECLSVLIWFDLSVIFSVINHPLLDGPTFYQNIRTSLCSPCFNLFIILASWDFPGSSMVKTTRFQCKGCRMDPWSGN